MKFIKTKTGTTLPTTLGVGAVFGLAASALVSMTPGGLVFQVSVLLLLGAALVRASALGAGVGTRALVPACVRVGRPAGCFGGRPYGLHASGPRRLRVAEASINHPASAGWEVSE